MWLPPGIELYEILLALLGLAIGAISYDYFSPETDPVTETVRSGAPPVIEFYRWKEANEDVHRFKKLAMENKRQADAYQLEIEGMRKSNAYLQQRLHDAIIETNRAVMAAGPARPYFSREHLEQERLRTQAEIVAMQWIGNEGRE